MDCINGKKRKQIQKESQKDYLSCNVLTFHKFFRLPVIAAIFVLQTQNGV